MALALLRRAVERFPGSARVCYALARAEREAAQADPITSWRRLMRLDEHYEPIFFLGAGRACLNRATGENGGAENEARDKLGRLAFWIRQRTEKGEECDLNDPQSDPRKCFRPRHKGDFAGWWAVEAQAELFGMLVPCASLVRTEVSIEMRADASAERTPKGLLQAFDSDHVQAEVQEIDNSGGSLLQAG